ncbi:MAG: ATP-binding cassette domain-containing protein [Acidobacteriota bacterium]|nr:ATP-binding cassette domain-containing protein [Acidobacteriota bacterium]
MTADAILLDPSRPFVVGRTADNDLTIEHPLISRHHARFAHSGAQWTVTDLGSTNGTYVNGRRTTTAAQLTSGDVVDLGGSRLILLDGNRLERRDYRGNTRIEAQNVAVTGGGRRLIEGVSMTLVPSELVGLMGPSGAGKTTLMTALAGYQPPSTGRVLFNGRDLYSSFDQFRHGIGYVPQDDILHGELTVGEALYFTGRLRLPDDTGADEIERRIDRVLRQLGIAHIRNSLIGTPARKVVSGGERKRVNVAMELLNDPPVLFLDEPTSGLSSEDALAVMQCLRDLAREGRTILLTIHQPSREVFRLMDNLAVVARDAGRRDPAKLVYYGPAYPEAIRFFNPGKELPADPAPEAVLRGLAERPAAAWHARYEQSALKRRFVDQRAGRQLANKPRTEHDRRSPAALRQALLLMRRGAALKVRDLWNSAILLAQAPIIALLLVLIFGGATRADANAAELHRAASATATVLFLMNIAAVWFGCSNAAREIVAEWAVFSRERMVGLRLHAYVAAKLGILGAIGLAQCILLLSIVHNGCRIEAPWPPILLGLVLSTLVGTALGLLISALARSSEVAISLVPMVILPLVVLGGMMQPMRLMEQPARTLAQLVPSRWAFEHAITIEAEHRHRRPGEADLAEPYFPAKNRSSSTTTGAVLAANVCVLLGGTLAILRSRDIHL